MKVTIVTPVLNNAGLIGGCLRSVRQQNYADLEHLIMDGGSTDGTLELINRFKRPALRVSTAADDGLYDALNKGIEIAKGDLIGVLGADDRLAGNDVISSVVHHFRSYSCDAVFGHLNFVARDNPLKVTRYWESRPYVRKSLELGWMPPHPALFIKRDLVVLAGKYASEFGSSGDYDLMLRLFYGRRINAVFLDKLLVCMLNGGISTGFGGNLIRAMFNDYRILIKNKIPMPLLAVSLKKLRKLKQWC